MHCLVESLENRALLANIGLDTTFGDGGWKTFDPGLRETTGGFEIFYQPQVDNLIFVEAVTAL